MKAITPFSPLSTIRKEMDRLFENFLPNRGEDDQSTPVWAPRADVSETDDAFLVSLDLPGIARYRQEFAALAPERRIRLEFPSPYLRHAPTRLAVEEGRSGTSRSWLTSETVSYEEPFELELIEFHAAIEEGREPTPEGLDGVRDVALAEAIAASHLDGIARERPTEMPVDASR
jgi:predicted dehydrogenase